MENHPRRVDSKCSARLKRYIDNLTSGMILSFIKQAIKDSVLPDDSSEYARESLLTREEGEDPPLTPIGDGGMVE